MARGQKSKKVIVDKLLDVFKGSFLYNDGKEVRIPIEEDGEIVQIKCVLTAAKTNVEEGSDNEVPSIKIVNDTNLNFDTEKDKVSEVVKISEEEKANLANLMKSLGL